MIPENKKKTTQQLSIWFKALFKAVYYLDNRIWQNLVPSISSNCQSFQSANNTKL